MRVIRIFLLLLFAAVPATEAVSQAASPNVLLLIGDDMGVDTVAAYNEGTSPPPTPNIDALAMRGVLFRNVYANPVCSPTRATIMTGRFSFRTGVGRGVRPGTPVLSLAEYTLPEVLAPSGYNSALFGKWHLSDATNGGLQGANLAGWSHFEGALWNGVAVSFGLACSSSTNYFNWCKVTNGVGALSTKYTTTDNVDAALQWIGTVQEPWVCCVAFNAPHNPFHAPPSGLHTRNLAGMNPGSQPIPFYKAMVEAMDTEIGRLLAGLGTAVARTNVIFIGDNGTPGEVSETPFLRTHAKFTMFEGGINVPLIIAGPAVNSPGREEKALVNSTDLFATIGDLAGVNVRSVVPSTTILDSVSVLPYLQTPNLTSIRSHAYAESFGWGGSRADALAIRDSAFKLIRVVGQQDRLYDLRLDPFEKNNLLLSPLSQEANRHFDELRIALAKLKGTAAYFPGGAGCIASGLPPVLTSTRPVLGGFVQVSVSSSLLSKTGIHLVGLAHPGLFGWPTCDIYVDGYSPTILLPFATNSSGDWQSSPLPVGASPAMVGLAIGWQAGIDDAATLPFGLALTNGLVLVIGY